MKIRLWKLGSIEEKIIPTKTTIDNFRELLKTTLKDEPGVVDLVWGPDVECEIIDTEDHDMFKKLKSLRRSAEKSTEEKAE